MHPIKSSLTVSTQGFFFCSLWSRNLELNTALRYSNKFIDSEKCLQVLFVIFTTDFCSIWHILQCSILISLNSFLQCKEAIYVCKIVISSQSIRKCLLSIPFLPFKLWNFKFTWVFKTCHFFLIGDYKGYNEEGRLQNIHFLVLQFCLTVYHVLIQIHIE